MSTYLVYFLGLLVSLQILTNRGIAQQDTSKKNDSLNQIVKPNTLINSNYNISIGEKIFYNNNSKVMGSAYWTNEFGPYGFVNAYGLDAEKTNGQLIFAGGSRGVARSLDGGNSWQLSESDFEIRDVLYDKLSNKLFAVGESEWIYFSTDLGQTWNYSSPNYNGWFCYWSEIAIDPFNPDNIFIGSYDASEHIINSVDGGFTWDDFVVAGIGRLSFITFHPLDSGKIFIGGENGIYYTTNLGRSWQQITQGLPNQQYAEFRDMVFKPTNPNIAYLVCTNSTTSNKVLFSNDGGLSWNDITNSVGYEYLWSIDIPIWNEDKIFIGGFYSTYSSFVPNYQWSSIFQKGSVEKLFTTNDNKLLLATRYNGIYKSSDQGITFQDAITNLSAANMRTVKYHPQNSLIALAAGWSGGIFRTVDGGEHWTKVYEGGYGMSVDVCENNPSIWYMCGADYQILKSTDTGLTWNYSGGNGQMIKIKCSPLNKDQVIVLSHYGGSSTASQSYDGGLTWSPISDIPGSSSAYYEHGIVFDPISNNNIYICTDDGLFCSTNGGQNWIQFEQTSLGDLNYYIDDSGIVHIYGILNNVIKSFSIPSNLQLENEFFVPINGNEKIASCRINPKNRKEVFILTNSLTYQNTSRFLYSRDGGTNWSNQSTGLQSYFNGNSCIDIDYKTGNRLIASTIHSVFRWVDSGTLPNIPLLSQPADEALDQPINICLAWLGSSNTAKYFLQVAKDSSFYNTIYYDSTITVDSVIVSGLDYLTKYFWRVKAKNENGYSNWSESWSFTTTTASSINDEYNKDNFYLYQNYPDPFNPSTTIKYSIPKQSIVIVKVYDILGREVIELVNAEKNSGSYSIKFTANDFAGGVYFYRIQAGDYFDTKKMILIK